MTVKQYRRTASLPRRRGREKTPFSLVATLDHYEVEELSLAQAAELLSTAILNPFPILGNSGAKPSQG